MPNKSGKRLDPKYRIILNGVMISLVCASGICALTACLTIGGYVPVSSMKQVTLLILLLSSFLGAKYSNTAAYDNYIAVTLITGLSFALMLIILNALALSAKYDDMLLKAIFTMGGTVFGLIRPRRKGKRGGTSKHRRNR